MTLSVVPITLSDAKERTHLSEWFVAHPNACGSDVALEILSRLSLLDATDIRTVARSYCTDEQRQYITTGFIWRGLLTLERNGQVERSRTSRSFKWRLRRSDPKRCHVCGLPRKGHAREVDATATMARILAAVLYNGEKKITLGNRSLFAHFVYEQAKAALPNRHDGLKENE